MLVQDNRNNLVVPSDIILETLRKSLIYSNDKIRRMNYGNDMPKLMTVFITIYSMQFLK